MNVPASALRGHLNHGDTIGACPIPVVEETPEEPVAPVQETPEPETPAVEEPAVEESPAEEPIVE